MADIEQWRWFIRLSRPPGLLPRYPRSFPPMSHEILRRTTSLALVAALSACALGPDFKRPEAPANGGYAAPGEENLPAKADIPNPQSEVIGQRISGEWWGLFRSSDLDQVVRQALTGNQTLVATRATLQQAEQQLRVAGGALYPQVNGSASFAREKENLSTFGLSGPSPVFNLYQVGPSVSYSLDLFGGLHRQVEEQAALAERAGYQLDAAYLTLTGNVVTQAITIASVRAQMRAVDDIIADDEKNLGLVQTEKTAGVANDADVLQAASQLDNDRTLLPPLRQQLAVARHALAVLIGKAPSEWTPPDFDLATLNLPRELPVTLPSELVRQRPDILAAEAELHAASAAIGVATAQMYPSIDLTAMLSQGALFPGQLWRSAATTASLGAGLTAPLFHGGSLEAQRDAAQNAYDASLATYKQTVLQSFGQVADTLQALTHDAESLAAQRHALESSEESLRLMRLSYSAGTVGVLPVIDAERLVQQARLGFVRAQTQRDLDTAQLYLAMGGGWWDWQAGKNSVQP